MSELLGGGYLSNDGVLFLWGVLFAIAVLKYAYSSRCGGRTLEEMLDPEEAEALRQQKAAEARLCALLDETTGPYEAAKSKQLIKEGDIEEGEDSKEQVEESSNDNDTNTDTNTDTKEEVRAFSNACAICLEEFEEGTNVVRSVTTKSCPHVFHGACLKEVIGASTRKGKYSIPCPCCRQTFVETDAPEQRSDAVQQ